MVTSPIFSSDVYITVSMATVRIGKFFKGNNPGTKLCCGGAVKMSVNTSVCGRQSMRFIKTE